MNDDKKKILELVEKSYNKKLFEELIQIISSTIEEEPSYFTFGEFSGIGFCYKPYKTKEFDGLYPYISITSQKNNISIYVFAVENGKSILSNYEHVFSKSNIGQSCIRIKKLTPERIVALKEILIKV